MARASRFFIRYFSNYHYRSDLAARDAPLDPRLVHACIHMQCFAIFSAIMIIFMAVYTELEVLKDSNYSRGWAVHLIYGALGTSIIASIEAMVYPLCCFDNYLEGVEKSNSLVLRPYTQRKTSRTSSYMNSSSHRRQNNGMISSNPYAVPSKDY